MNSIQSSVEVKIFIDGVRVYNRNTVTLGSGSSAGRALYSYADDLGSSPGEHTISIKSHPPSTQSWTYWDINGVSISYHVYVVWDLKNHCP